MRVLVWNYFEGTIRYIGHHHTLDEGGLAAGLPLASSMLRRGTGGGVLAVLPATHTHASARSSLVRLLVDKLTLFPFTSRLLVQGTWASGSNSTSQWGSTTGPLTASITLMPVRSLPHCHLR